MAPQLQGIHHLKIAVSDLATALKFYETALFAERISALDHFRTTDGVLYAHILKVPGLGTFLELRLDPEAALKHRLFNSITLAVEDRKMLGEWEEHLSKRDVLHSPVITGLVGWVIVVEDPDGNRLRLYTLETHGPELSPDDANDWLLG